MELNIFVSLVAGTLSPLYFINAVRTFRILSPIRSETYTEKRSTDGGDSVVIRGNVNVESPPEESRRLFPGDNPAVGAYVWRVTHDENGLYQIDVKNRTISRSKVGYESGIEFGDFSITTGNQSAKIDPAWLTNTHDSIPLSEVTISTIPRTINLSPDIWSSPYVRLTSTETVHPIEEVLDLIGSKDVGGPQYYVESKPIASEATLTVYGNVRLEDGTPILYGTDAVPLALTNREPPEFRRYLARRLAKNGVLSLLLVVIAIGNWFVI